MCARNACCRAVWWKACIAVGVLMVLRSCCTIDIPDCMVLSFFLLLLLPFGIRFRMMLCRYHTHDTPVYRRRLSTLYYYGERNKSKKRKKEKNTTEKRSHSNNANWGAFSTWCEWTKQEKETGSWIYIQMYIYILMCLRSTLVCNSVARDDSWNAIWKEFERHAENVTVDWDKCYLKT